MPFDIDGFIWIDAVIDKVIGKHGIYPEEVEECFFNLPYKVRRAREGKYYLFGRANSGRYIFVVFVWQEDNVKIITARDMTDGERRYYSQK